MAMTPRTTMLLRHTGLHRITLRAVWERLLDIDPSNVIKRLRSRGWLVARTGLPNSISYYQLTLEAAEELELPSQAAEVITDGQRFNEYLAALWFCEMNPPERCRMLLTHNQVRRFVEPRASQTLHAVHRNGGHSAIWSIYVPGAATKLDDVLDRLDSKINECLRARDGLSSWVESRNYGFCVLGHDAERCEEIRIAAANSGLTKRASILVESAPQPFNLHWHLHHRRR